MTTTQSAVDFATWAIVFTAGRYEAREVAVSGIGAPEVVAIHPSRSSAKAGLKRVRIANGLRQPRWRRGSRAHAMALRESLARAIREVALPRPQADQPLAMG